jgi:hypothetical protein
VAQP